MGLFDIIDEIAEKQVTKTEMGDNRVWGLMVGKVVKNFDDKSSGGGGTGQNSGADAMDGRVCVSIPTRDENANELKWARVAMPSGGSGWGHYFLPEENDQVLLAFEGGNIEKPYVIGCIQRYSDKFLKDSVDKDNQIKRIMTRHGSHVTFFDNAKDDEGAKDVITVETPQQALQIQMDNENQKIRIGDKPTTKENFMELSTKDGSGSLTIQVKNSLSIKVGDNITVTMNGETGGVTIKAKSILLEGTDKVASKSDSTISMEAGEVSAKATTSLKLNSDNTASLGGSTISIG